MSATLPFTVAAGSRGVLREYSAVPELNGEGDPTVHGSVLTQRQKKPPSTLSTFSGHDSFSSAPWSSLRLEVLTTGGGHSPSRTDRTGSADGNSLLCAAAQHQNQERMNPTWNHQIGEGFEVKGMGFDERGSPEERVSRLHSSPAPGPASPGWPRTIRSRISTRRQETLIRVPPPPAAVSESLAERVISVVCLDEAISRLLSPCKDEGR
jgi:hypothetical protein